MLATLTNASFEVGKYSTFIMHKRNEYRYTNATISIDEYLKWISFLKCTLCIKIAYFMVTTRSKEWEEDVFKVAVPPSKWHRKKWIWKILFYHFWNLIFFLQFLISIPKDSLTGICCSDFYSFCIKKKEYF